MPHYVAKILGADHPARFMVGFDINDAGEVAGGYDGPNDRGVAFRYDPASGINELPPESFSESGLEPYAINASGDIVGMALDDAYIPFICRKGSAPHSLVQKFTAAGFTSPFVVDINDAGLIAGAGYVEASHKYRSLVLTKQLELLPFAPDPDGDPWAITERLNNTGLIVGEVIKSGLHNAYVYDLNAKTSHLFPPVVPSPNDHGSFAEALSDQGEVAIVDSPKVTIYKDGVETLLVQPENGYFQVPIAFVQGLIVAWDGMIYDRNDPSSGWQYLSDHTEGLDGWHIDYAVAANAKGQILVRATTDDSPTSSKTRPVVLTPGAKIYGPRASKLDISRFRAIARILFGIVEDAPGLAIVGTRPQHVGPGPGDPGPLPNALADLGSATRETLLGLCLAEIGALLESPTLGREARALAARVISASSGRIAASGRREPAPRAGRFGGRAALRDRVYRAARQRAKTDPAK